MNILNEPEKATCQKRAPFQGIDRTLRSQSQLYIKSTCSLSYIFNRFVRFTLCIKAATRSEGNSQFATDRKQNCFLGRPGPQIRFFGFRSWYAFFNHLTLAHRLSFAHSSGSSMLLVWTNLENLNSVPPCGSLDGRGVWGRMGTYICMAGLLCCAAETTTILLIG